MRALPRRLELADIMAEAFASFGDLIETPDDALPGASEASSPAQPNGKR